jgi:hypothetical protein
MVFILDTVVVVVKKIYDFIGSSFRCTPLASMTNLHAPNFSFDHHLFLDSGRIIPNLKSETLLSGLVGFFFS